MGAGASIPVNPVKPGFSTMCVSFQSSDRITVLHLDDAGLSVIRQAINEAWRSGISLEKTVCGSAWCFKLSGNPFRSISWPFSLSSDTSKQVRQMVCKILEKLSVIGWKIIATTDLGMMIDKSTLFFKKSSPEFSILPYVCVSLTSSDKLQIINLPPQLEKPIKETIRRSWSRGIQNEIKTNGMLEIKLSGNPWTATEQQSVMAKVLLQNIISTLRRYQWAYCCNVNLNSSADSLFFRYDPNITPGESTPFCTISFNRCDRLNVINAPNDMVAMIRKVIETTWLPGVIQKERDFHGSWEFKLSGNPWYSTKEESVMARYLVLKILEAMQEQGWHNIASIVVNRGRPTDKSVLIFQKGEPKSCPMMCLSLNDADKFRLINMPPQLVELFKRILLSRWSKGIQAEKELTLSFDRVCQIKLSGLPWYGSDWKGALRSDTLHAHSFLCNIIEEFRQRGWALLLCADVSTKYVSHDGLYYPVDVHSMWFVYDPNASAESSAPTYGFNFALAPEQNGIGIPSLPYASANASQMPAYGVQPALYLQPADLPPTYGQATG